MSAPTPARMGTDGLSRKHLKSYPKAVADVLVEAVNDYGVKHRLLDGGHIRLYCGDRSITPIKIAASRPPEHTLRHLEPWLEKNTAWRREIERREAAVAALKVVERSDEMEETESPATAVGSAFAEAVKGREPTDNSDGFEPFIYKNGKDSHFDHNGEVWRCRDCGLVVEKIHALAPHWNQTHDPELAEQWRVNKNEGRKRSLAAKRAEREREELEAQQHEMHVQQAMRVLMEHFEIGASEERIQDLERQVADLRVERDDLRAKLDLLKDALNA